MKTIFIDCGMGAAGDMLTAALLELLPDPDEFVEELNALGIPGVHYEKEASVKCGIKGTHVRVTVDGEEEESHDHHDHENHHHDHHHDHEEDFGHPHEHEADQVHFHNHEEDHGHHHDHEEGHDHHHHASMRDVEHIITEHLNIPADVREDAISIYNLIAEAESHVHGVPVTEIHFHEVGTMDAIADVVAVCLLMKRIAPDKVVVSPVHVGSGQVHCAHGILPVPAPATAYILKDVPSYGGAIRGELCTPTGAALLKHFATEFGNMPVMSVQKIGYGMGKKDFEAANCVRAMLGETQNYQMPDSLRSESHKLSESNHGEDICDDKKHKGNVTEAVQGEEMVYELSCNVDDMTGEEVGFAMERLFEAGARDVYTISVGMKKNRPGILIRALCMQSEKEKIVEAMFRHTTTIGIRECALSRYVLDRKMDQMETPCGLIHRKTSSGYGTKRQKLEFEDLARIAREQGISLWEARTLSEKP